MTLTGLHLLLTYGCTFECDHCFVWSSPRQPGTVTLAQLREILEQAREVPTIEWFYFEGGEPFLYHGLLRWGVRRAADMGFRVGIVTNAYWATGAADAEEWLRDLAGRVEDLSISCDPYHGDRSQEERTEHAQRAAERLGIAAGVIRIAPPETESAATRVGQLPPGESTLMFRGRAAERLAHRAPGRPWDQLACCPYEDLREPGRVHVDPLGYVHVCQGIAIGNVFRTRLAEIGRSYRPDRHPIVAALLEGGPAELARRYDLPHRERYADACHFCDHARRALRARFPELLAPDAMYGPVPS